MTPERPLSEGRKQQLVTKIQKDFSRDTTPYLRNLLTEVHGDGPEFLNKTQIEEILALARPGTTVSGKPRSGLRSITRQGRAGRKVKYIPKALERRPIPGYPGCEIDSNHHVFRDGNEAAYSFNKRFRTCARIKHESGQWHEPSIINLMEKVEFRRAYVKNYKPKNPYAPYTDLEEAHAEDPEAFPDPSCQRNCCPENAD